MARRRGRLQLGALGAHARAAQQGGRAGQVERQAQDAGALQGRGVGSSVGHDRYKYNSYWRLMDGRWSRILLKKKPPAGGSGLAPW